MVDPVQNNPLAARPPAEDIVPQVKTDSSITADRIEQAIRQRYSPFPEMSMELLAQQLSAFRIGEIRPAARTWEIMFERDGELSTAGGKRFKDCARLDSEIFASEKSAEADAHKAALEYLFEHSRATSVLDQDETGGLNLMLRQLLTAHAYKYSVHEMLLQVHNPAKKQIAFEFRHCPAYFFEARRGWLGYLQTEGQVYGTPLLPGEWLVGVGEGLMRQASIAYLIKHFPLRDSLLYCARFGLPAVHGETDAEPNSERWNDMVNALKQFMNDFVIVTNQGAKINLVEAAKGGQGTLPFDSLIEMSNKLYSKLFRGSDLATGSQKQAVGATLQVSELNVFLGDDAVWASDIINERIVRPAISYLFGTEPKAWFKLIAPKPDTTDRDIKCAEFLRDSGVPVGVTTVRDRLGWPEPEDGDDILKAPANPSPNEEDTALGIGARQRAGLANSKDQNELATSFAKDLAPVLAAMDQRMDQILSITDPTLRLAKFKEIWEQLAPLRKDIAADPASARVLEGIMAKGFARGLINK